MTGTVAIKMRRIGTVRFQFLTTRGTGNYLRIHAARFTPEDADKVLAEIRPMNPDLEFKPVTLGRSTP